MEHIYRPGKDNAPTLILLHGTGGDETDLYSTWNSFKS